MKPKSNQLSHFAIFFGALFGLLGVLIGAFGSHVLSKSLEIQAVAWLEIGVRYQFTHALALLFSGLWMRHLSGDRHLKWAIVFFITGTLLFSGSLYVLALSGMKFFAAITPIGGFCLIIAWTILVTKAYQELRT